MSPHTRPRPILKRQVTASRQTTAHALPFATCSAALSPHVHFPPTPRLVASTHPAHSPRTYDRKPILVSPNVCDLPSRSDRKLHSPPADFEIERTERGRSRGSRSSSQETDVKGSYFHPRAFEACEPEPAVEGVPLTPPLLRRRPSYSDSDDYDSDSDSDSDSDAVTTPPDPKLSTALPQVQQDLSSSHHLTPYAPHVAGLQLDAHIDEKSRPQLVRAHRQPTITIVSSRDSDVLSSHNEGCLGGF